MTFEELAEQIAAAEIGAAAAEFEHEIQVDPLRLAFELRQLRYRVAALETVLSEITKNVGSIASGA